MVMTRTNVLIVHGTLGSPSGNWFPWLAGELKASRYECLIPKFPTPDDQNLASWLEIAQESLAGLDPANTILVGHSMGAGFVLRLAEKTSVPYRSVFCVCPFTCKLDLEPYDALNATFVESPFNWDRVRQGAKAIHCFAGSDDPYVPLAYSEDVARNVGTPLTVVPRGGHLNAETGYVTFSALLEKIETESL